MERAMRRKDKEISDRTEMEAVLREAKILHLGLAKEGDPYVVPLCFGFEDGKIYIHGAKQGLKMDLMRENPHVSFAVETGVEIIDNPEPCEWSMRYRSVIGFGKARFLEDPEEKRRALEIVVRQFAGRGMPMPPQAVMGTEVVEIAIERMTGRKSKV